MQPNVSRQAVSKWETGRSYPNYEILTEISKLIDVKIEELFGEKTWILMLFYTILMIIIFQIELHF